MPELLTDAAAGRLGDVFFAVNKCDLLPSSSAPHRTRLEIWIRTELKRMGLPSGVNMAMVSSKTGFGIKGLMIGVKVRARDVRGVLQGPCARWPPRHKQLTVCFLI